MESHELLEPTNNDDSNVTDSITKNENILVTSSPVNIKVEKDIPTDATCTRPSISSPPRYDMNWSNLENANKNVPMNYGEYYHGMTIQEEEGGLAKIYACRLCDFKTQYSNSLMNHQAVHSDIRPWVCEVCRYAAKRKQDLKKHLHTIHGLMVDSTMLKPVYGDALDDNIETKSRKSNSDAIEFGPAHSNINSNFSFKKENVFSDSKQQPALRSESWMDSPSPPAMPDNHPSISSVSHSSHISEDGDDDSLQVTFQSTNFNNKLDLPDEKEIKKPQTYPIPQAMPNHANPPNQNHFNERHNQPWFGQPHFQLSQNIRNRQTNVNRNYHFETLNRVPSEPPIMYDDDQVKAVKRRYVETDKAITSSSMVSHSSSTQTCQSFYCEHCDIIFFQRAMFVMHTALHSKENPWKCSVCGCLFTEKYSFTSHFINQH